MQTAIHFRKLIKIQFLRHPHCLKQSFYELSLETITVCTCLPQVGRRRDSLHHTPEAQSLHPTTVNKF